MPRFIPIDKMTKLREAAKSGDVRTQKILKAQLSDSDFSADLDEYFKPQPKPEPVQESKSLEPTKLELFLRDNQIKEGDPEYASFVEDFYKEFPNERREHHHEEECCEEKTIFDKLMDEELDAIRSYGDAILEVMRCEEYTDNEKKGIIAKLTEIKNDEAEHYEELARLKKDTIKKDEEKAPLE